jgi:simple sugar transport system permease protein
LTHGWRRVAGVVAGLSVVLGFLTWAASSSTLPFPVSNQLAGTVALATPLILGSLAGVVGERAGVVNVAIEGQFLNAAFTAALVGSVTKSIPAALAGAVLAAVLTGALLALFAIKYLVDQVVLGVVINLLASGLTGFLFDQLVQPNSSELNASPIMSTIPLGPLADIPLLGPILFDQTILVYLAVISVALVWFLLFKTRWGLRVRAVGEHPKAADTVGISVIGVRWQAVLVGAIFAGLGGAFFTVGSTGTFVKDITVGNGFIALAALIMGRWHPVRAALMGLFFGFVTQMASQLQTLSTPVPSQFLLLLPYVATIIAVAGLIGRTRAPAADGIPYIK